MNTFLHRIISERRTQRADGELISIEPSSCTLKEVQILESAVKAINAQKTLEIGLAFGISALAICQALKDNGGSQHTAVDPHQFLATEQWQGQGIYNLTKAGLINMVEFFNMPSYRALPLCEQRGDRFDLAFIDGWHTFDFAFVDFFYVDKILREGGYLVMDDSDWPSIAKLCAYIESNRAYRRLAEFQGEDMVVYEKSHDDNRNWDFHVDF